MSYSFSEKSPMAIVLWVSELKTSPYPLASVRTLLERLPRQAQRYLVSVQAAIPPLFYNIPCIASLWEQEREQARQALLSLGADLGISPENCLLLSQSGSFFKKTRLKQQLERQLKCPVRLLSLAENETWMTIPPVVPETLAKQPRVQRHRTRQKRVKIRALARSSVLS